MAAADVFTEVTGEPLDLAAYAARVSDPGAGAISTFSGITRNNFQGKAVLRLEYEAYVPMANKKLQVKHFGFWCVGVSTQGPQLSCAQSRVPQSPA